MFSDSKATLRSRDTVARTAELARERAGLSNELNINLVDYINGFLKLRLKIPLDVNICEQIDDGAEAFVKFFREDNVQLNVRKEIWIQAKQNFPRARFILAHEVGHIVMHKNDALAYSSAPYSLVRALSEEERVEPQANWFADEFLAPLHMLIGLNNVYEVADYLNVPESCARRQLEKHLDNQRRRGLVGPYSDMCPKCGSLTLDVNGKCSNYKVCL